MSINAVVDRIIILRSQLRDIIGACERIGPVCKRIVEDLRIFDEKLVELLRLCNSLTR